MAHGWNEIGAGQRPGCARIAFDQNSVRSSLAGETTQPLQNHSCLAPCHSYDPAMSTIVLRAKPRVLARDLRTRLGASRLTQVGFVLLLGLFVETMVQFWATMGWISLATLGAFAIITFVEWMLVKLNARITISDDSIEYRNAMRVHHNCPRSQVHRAIRMQVFMANQRLGRLLLLNRQDRALLSIHDNYFSDADLRRICQELSLGLVELPGTMRARAANRQFPGAASYLVLHPYMVTAGTLLVLCILAVLAAAAVTTFL